MRVQTKIGLLGALLALCAIGCGDITAEADAPDAGGAGGGSLVGSGGHAFGTGGFSGGTGGARGTGGAMAIVGTGGATAQSAPFCAPTEKLAVDPSACEKLDPGGTFSYRMKNGHTCALCDPSGGTPVTNLPCLYTDYLCVRACQDCD